MVLNKKEENINSFEKIRQRIEFIVFEKHHILLFILTIWLLLYFSHFPVFLSRSINIYQVAAFSAAYSYMNTNMTIYTLLMSAFISSFIAYLVYQSLYKSTSLLIINAIITLLVIITTDLLNCFMISSLIYAMIAVKEIPLLKSGYLFSYFFACIGIVLLYFIYTHIVLYLQKNYQIFLNYDFIAKKWI